MKLSFKMRILIPSIIVVLLAFSVTGIIVYKTMNSAIEKLAMENMSNLSHSYGNTIQTYIGEALTTASIMASSAETFTRAQTPREEVSAFVTSILQKNPTLVDAIIVWEPNAFDGKDNEFAGSNTIGTTPEGRFAPMSDRSSGSISSSFAKHIVTGGAASTWYDQPLKSGKAFISDPSTHTFDGKDITTITVSVPFKSGERVLGVASVDVSMDIINDMIKKLEVYQTGYPFLLSNSFVTIAHHNADRIGRISDMAAQIAEPVAQNKDFLTKKISAVSGKYSYTMYTPVPINGTDYKFVFCISAPQKEVLAASDKVRDAILIVALLSVICVSFLLTLLVKRLMKLMGGEPQDVLHAIHKVSQGDFTVDITSKSCEPDSIAGSVQCMVDTFKGIITEIIDISEKLKVSSGELSTGAQELSAGVSNQAERAMQISAASSEMAATTEDIARNLTDISTFANQTAEKTVNGDRVVNDSLQSISQIKNTVEHSFKLVNSLGEKSKGISDIVNVISDIADQTNLLALNAAIEAARVGEAGRGFAVVADEVRKLAERTQHATSEISTLVASTLSEVDNVIQSMDGVAGKVNTGVESSKQITVVLKNIEHGVSQLQSMVENISTATQEMSATSNQVQQDIDSVASVSTQASATSSHLAKSSSSLESISLHLRTMMTRFKITKN